MVDPSPPQISVTDFVSRMVRRGDLYPEQSYYGSQSLPSGNEIHQYVTKKRIKEKGPDYLKEFPLSAVLTCQKGSLNLTGRIDGLLQNPLFIEEIKSHSLNFGDIPLVQKERHLLQAKLYALMILQGDSQQSVDIQLTYVNAHTFEINEINYRLQRGELDREITPYLERYLSIREKRLERREERNQGLEPSGDQFDVGA